MSDFYYQHHIFFCTNQRENGEPCCGEHDAQALRSYMKQQVKQQKVRGRGMVQVNATTCMGRCDLGPVVVVYPEGVWYTYNDEADLDEIIEEHFKHGRIVERLRVG